MRDHEQVSQRLARSRSLSFSPFLSELHHNVKKCEQRSSFIVLLLLLLLLSSSSSSSSFLFLPHPFGCGWWVARGGGLTAIVAPGGPAGPLPCDALSSPWAKVGGRLVICHSLKVATTCIDGWCLLPLPLLSWHLLEVIDPRDMGQMHVSQRLYHLFESAYLAYVPSRHGMVAPSRTISNQQRADGALQGTTHLVFLFW